MSSRKAVINPRNITHLWHNEQRIRAFLMFLRYNNFYDEILAIIYEKGTVWHLRIM